MVNILKLINTVVWGVPALFMILGVGCYLSIQTKFAQIRLFPKALKRFVGQFNCRRNANGVSSYRALCTALAATVGTGNIAGVAGAIAIGGPGAIFWMWICSILGMITKFAEATLAVKYRVRNASGELVGGPMYMIRQALPNLSWLASIYCFFGVIAAFGVGNSTQINAVIGGINSVVIYLGGKQRASIDFLLGVILAALLFAVLCGGVKRIGCIAEEIVPYAAVGYLLLCLIILIVRIQEIPYAFSMIVEGAFRPNALTGGIVGSVFTVLRVGASRGVFTNEAGMGTASIAHAASNISHPVEQGLMGIIEVFIDTTVICTMTALVILCSDLTITYGADTGALLTTQAFASILGDWVCIPLAVFMCCFAFATVLGWGLYGIRCSQYLFGTSSWKTFVVLQVIIVPISAILKTETIWMLAETVNGLMAIPNLIILAYLIPELRRLMQDYNHYVSLRTSNDKCEMNSIKC